MLSAVSETVTTMPDGPRYEDDFFAWTQHQAMVLRAMAVADNRFDRENVAVEIEDLGRSERDALPQRCPYSLDDIFREDWYPEPPGEQP